jgi:hypothetical protein
MTHDAVWQYSKFTPTGGGGGPSQHADTALIGARATLDL